MNNELALIADMLCHNELITEIDVDPIWFENRYCEAVAQVLLELAGTNYRIQDVFRELKAKNPFEAGTLDDLQQLADSNPDNGIAYHLAELIRYDYIERELKKTSQEYALTGANSKANRLAELLDQKSDMETSKSSGSIQDALVEFDEMCETPDLLLKTYQPLDDLLGGGFVGGELIVIGARPGIGKTAFALNLMDVLQEKNGGVRTDFFTLEMTKWQLMSRVVAKQARINSALLKDPSRLSPENRAKSREIIRETMQKDIEIYNADHEQLNDICRVIKRRAIKNKYVAFIDYAGLISVKDSRKNERQVLNEVTRRLKKLTGSLGITIVLLSQLNREIENRQVKRPTLADLKESGSLEQDANTVMFLSKVSDDPNDKSIYVDIAKNRAAITGTVIFKFLGHYMDFSVDFDNQYKAG